MVYNLSLAIGMPIIFSTATVITVEMHCIPQNHISWVDVNWLSNTKSCTLCSLCQKLQGIGRIHLIVWKGIKRLQYLFEKCQLIFCYTVISQKNMTNNFTAKFL